MEQEQRTTKRTVRLKPIAWCQTKIRSMFRFDRDMYPKRDSAEAEAEQAEQKVVH